MAGVARLGPNWCSQSGSRASTASKGKLGGRTSMIRKLIREVAGFAVCEKRITELLEVKRALFNINPGGLERLLRALAMFAGSVMFMRNFGDLMAI